MELAVIATIALGSVAAAAIAKNSGSETQDVSLKYITSNDVDCKMTDWKSTPCVFEKDTCGPGTVKRTREIITPAQFGGKPCGPTEETSSCYTPCPIDCKVGDFTPWSECVFQDNQTCGAGYKKRVKPIQVLPQYGGQACPPKETLEESDYCEKPCDCKVSDWSQWSECKPKGTECGTGKGEQTRTRTVITPSSFQGAACPVLSETRSCDIPCPQDCAVVPVPGQTPVCTPRIPGQCGPGSGTMKVPLKVDREPLFNGKPCPVNMEDTLPCDVPCPTDCTFGFTDWSECTPAANATCNRATGMVQGVRTKPARKLTEAANGGKCEAPPSMTETCFMPCDVDCATEMSSQAPWSQCVPKVQGECGPKKGTQKKSLRVVQGPLNRGNMCPIPLEISQDCDVECPVDCVTSDWSEWTPCRFESGTCGQGSQKRTRTVLTPARSGGKECGPLEETKACSQECPVDCLMNDWQPQGRCGLPTGQVCGTGRQEYTRTIRQAPNALGKPCGPMSEFRECNVSCLVDCEMTPWSEWTQCQLPSSATCGTGAQSRTRSITKNPSQDGAPCGPVSESRACAVPCQGPMMFKFTGGSQSWVAPRTGVVTVTLVGGAGGNADGEGGKGGYITVQVNVQQSAEYEIVVGGRGSDANSNRGSASGGGGTGFRLKGDPSFWVIAGGGGGGGAAGNGTNARGGNGGIPPAFNGSDGARVNNGMASGASIVAPGRTFVARNRFGTGTDGQGNDGGRGIIENNELPGAFGAGRGGSGGGGNKDFAAGGGGGGWFGGGGGSHGSSGEGPGGGGGSTFYNVTKVIEGSVSMDPQTTDNGNGWLNIVY